MANLFGIGRAPISHNIGMTATIMQKRLFLQKTRKRSGGAAMAEDLYEIFPEMAAPDDSWGGQSGLT